MPRDRASSLSSSMGSMTPWGNDGAEPTMTTVSSVMAASVAATSARQSGPVGTWTISMPKY